jgi:hypothetical protein
MTRIIEAPAEYDDNGPSLFVAGGITGYADWQADYLKLLQGVPLTLLNPRNRTFPKDDPAASAEQVVWEHRHLRRASAVSFWFPGDGLCPVTMYELGAWSMSTKPLFVGAHPDFARRLDVEVQTRLARPDVRVVGSLDELAEQVRAWARNLG